MDALDKMDALEKVPPPASPQGVEVPYDNQNKESPYMIMCIQANQARRWYTVGAALFSWLILAGYLVLPHTFTSLQSSKALTGSKSGQMLQSTIQNFQLLPFAGIFCFIGILGSSLLWYIWRENYVSLITYIFL
jgi:hypothetical protein